MRVTGRAELGYHNCNRGVQGESPQRAVCIALACGDAGLTNITSHASLAALSQQRALACRPHSWSWLLGQSSCSPSCRNHFLVSTGLFFVLFQSLLGRASWEISSHIRSMDSIESTDDICYLFLEMPKCLYIYEGFRDTIPL